MQNRFYHVIASSSNTKKNRGVIILAKRTYQYTDLGSGRDTEGRVAYIKTLINGTKIAFLSVYAPNVFDAEFYNYLTNTILELSEFSLIIGGDFHAVWLHSLDRTGITESREQCLASSALREWAIVCSVVDAW